MFKKLFLVIWICYLMINDAIAATVLNTRAIITIIEDVPIWNDSLRSFFYKTRVILNVKPIIPKIRLAIEKIMVD